LSWLVFGGLSAAFAAMAWALPEAGLALAAWALLWDLPLSLGPLTIFSSEAVLLGLALGAWARLGWRPLLERSPRPLLGLSLAWVLWMGAHALSPGPVWGGIKGALRAGELCLGLALPLWLGVSRRVIIAALGAACFAAAWGSLQSLLGPDSVLNAGRGVELIHGFQAGAASLGHHNQLGAYMAAALPLCAAFALTATGARRGALAVLVLLGAGLFASFSRGAWLGLGLGAVLAAAAWSWRWGLGLIAAISLALALAFWGPSDALHQRVASLGADSDRQFLAQQAWGLWDGHYAWGLGPGRIDRDWPARVQVPGRPDASQAFSAHLHNTYLQWAVEFGVLAALLPLALLAWLMTRAWGLKGPARVWALALLAMSVAFILQAGTDVLTLHARGACLSLCWGLALALAEDARPSGRPA
jgi:O-antigen ligase